MKVHVRKLLLTILFFLFFSSHAFSVNVMTPYKDFVPPTEFYNGATFIIESSNFSHEKFWTELDKANSSYNINTITIYGLETFDNKDLEYIFSCITRLNMKLVVRLESYSSDFAFRAIDAENVVQQHERIYEFCARAENRDTIAYFAINMPVDDPLVQKNAGGLNSKAWIAAQLEYAYEIIALLRNQAKRYGWDDVPLYLSVFYGWDNSFNIPSYKECGADGYFINNYSYPDGAIAKSGDKADKLINAKRLKVSMDRFVSQYGDNVPLVMEWGFHTVEYNEGVVANQNAGLVWDRDAKEQAMKATVDFYKKNYPQVRGCLYFGYNLFKEEGNPPVLLDWCLRYPTIGWCAASLSTFRGSVKQAGDNGVVLTEKGDSIEFSECPEAQMLILYYSADTQVKLNLYSGGRKRRSVFLPRTEGKIYYGIPVINADGASFSLVLEDGGELYIESVLFSGSLEAEYALGAKCLEEKTASNGYATTLNENAITFSGVRGGDELILSYKAKDKAKLTLSMDGKRVAFSVPASKDFRTINVKIPVYRNAEISIMSDSGSLLLDSVEFKGIPKSK